jgi:hypothetical protein
LRRASDADTAALLRLIRMPVTVNHLAVVSAFPQFTRKRALGPRRAGS